MGKDKVNKILRRQYYTPGRAEAYGGVVSLQRGSKLDADVVKEWLSHQDIYTLHKPSRRRFKGRMTIVGGVDQQFQADLTDLRNIRKYNDGYSYLVICIDVFSKYAWAIPINTKTGEVLVEAVSKIFAERKPINFQTDKGSEFVNKTFLKYLKDEGVHFFTTENADIKSAVVERLNRTLKDKLW